GNNQQGGSSGSQGGQQNGDNNQQGGSSGSQGGQQNGDNNQQGGSSGSQGGQQNGGNNQQGGSSGSQGGQQNGSNNQQGGSSGSQGGQQNGSNNQQGGSSGSGNPTTQDSGYSSYTSVEKCELNFDHAMGSNMPLADYVTWANEHPQEAVKELTLQLQKGTDTSKVKTIRLGNNDGYVLSVTFEKTNDNQIKVIPSCKKPNGEMVDAASQKIKTALTKPYFNKKDALNYILRTVQTVEGFYKPDTEQYASALYTTVQTGGKGITPQGIFDESKLEAYKNAYNNSSGYLQIKNIGAYIYNQQITANDCEGTLTVQYVIASSEDIIEGSLNDKNLSDTISKTLTGFKKINQETARNLFQFTVMKGTASGSEETKLKAWMQKNITGSQSRLLSEEGTPGTNGWKIKKNTQVEQLLCASRNENGYYVTLNQEDIERECCLGTDVNPLSTGKDNSKLLVKRVLLTKNRDSKELTISMTFCKDRDEETFTWTVLPLSPNGN
ncbi:MAG: hypothetical protein ACTTH7_00780, partial [Treponema sp.]